MTNGPIHGWSGSAALPRSLAGGLLLLGFLLAPVMPGASGTAVGQAASADPIPALPHPEPFTAAEYAERRAALAAAMSDDGVFVAFGSPEPELDYLPYAQNSPFRYLTGVLEPEAALIMVRADGAVDEMLFVRTRNPARELWEGERLGIEGARSLTGITAQVSTDLVPTLDRLLAEHRTLYVLTPLLADPARMETLTREQQILRNLMQRHPETRILPLNERLQRLRARKSPTEVDMIRRAVAISTLAHREAMRSTAPGMNEFEIQGLVEYTFRRHGAERPAYSSIVGSGPNSTTLHYRAADRFMGDGEVLLLDVGASYRGYAADVTRTMPVNGRFSPEQRAVYQIVLEAQKAAEQQVRIGGRWDALEGAANQVIARGLADLGLIDAPDATYVCEAPQTGNRCPQMRLFYMHGLGHGVGLDVHDPDISYFEAFEPGSAFTIEPGVYVRSDVFDFLRDAPENRAMIERLRPTLERYRDIGVRIEDVYIVTEQGVERASEGAPREIDEIEALMAERGLGQERRRPEVVEWYRQTSPRR
jgi:Xaa-Pro aminopeptidase